MKIDVEDTIKKFRFKDKGVILNAPPLIEEAFVKSGFATALNKTIRSTNTIAFINNKQEYINFLTNELQYIESNSVLWFAYPKGTSKIKTDINRDTLRITGESFGITTVTAISIDDIWSGLRFKPIDKVGKK